MFGIVKYIAKYLKDRYRVLGIIFTIAYLAIITQLINLQIIHGYEYDLRSGEIFSNGGAMMAPRGDIVDRNGVVIATSRVNYDLRIEKVDISVQQLNSEILELTKILEKNHNSYANDITKYLHINPIGYEKSAKSGSNRSAWIRRISNGDLPSGADAETVFLYLKSKFSIADYYPIEDMYSIMRIRYEMMVNNWSSTNSVIIAKNISKSTIAEIEEKKGSFNGIVVAENPSRRYINSIYAAHVIGYLGRISTKEYSELRSKGYGVNDYVGKSGIEGYAEDYLRGIPGINSLMAAKDGRQVKLSEKGDNVKLTIDMRLQKVAMNSLARNITKIKHKRNNRNNFGDACAGAVVAINPKTGEILAMVSYPSYLPDVYVTKPNNEKMRKLRESVLNDKKNAPLYNRATHGVYAPGSAYKPITAIAGLQENVIQPNTVIYDRGVADIGGKKLYCMEYRKYHWSHGALTLNRALATSCNMYFFIVGSKTGINKLDKWAKFFGLGEKTGIEISEKQGVRATPSTARSGAWSLADTAQVAIGQSGNAFTPIQLANYVATIGNGGKKFQPRLIKEVYDYEGNTIRAFEPSYTKLPVDAKNIEAVKQGMIDVANSSDGTAAGIFRGFPFKVAGKTGTAEVGKGINRSCNAVFVCYAPAKTPEIAICVIIERGVWGAYAAPVAKDILREYFKDRLLKRISSKHTEMSKEKPKTAMPNRPSNESKPHASTTSKKPIKEGPKVSTTSSEESKKPDTAMIE